MKPRRLVATMKAGGVRKRSILEGFAVIQTRPTIPKRMTSASARALTWVALLLLSLDLCSASDHEDASPVVHMSGRYRQHTEPATIDRRGRLRVFCFSGMARRVYFLFHAAFLNLSAVPDDLQLFTGANESLVLAEYGAARRSVVAYWWGVATWKKGAIPLAPFRRSCVGLSTGARYELRLEYKVEAWRPLLLLAGVALFWRAPRLSRSMALYYSCGVSVSLAASLVLVAFILHRLLPFRRGLYALLAFSSATTLAVWDFLARNLEAVLLEHRALAVSYVAVVSALSFALLYHQAPRVSSRTRDLVRWGLQAAGLGAVLLSSQIPEAACALVLLLLLLRNFPRQLLLRARLRWYRWFPKRRRYLSEDEYRETVREATQRALDDLRAFCRGPDCQSWSLVGRLRSPGRFASFVEGESHLLATEEEAYTDWETSSISPGNGRLPSGDAAPVTDDEGGEGGNEDDDDDESIEAAGNGDGER